MKKSFIFLAEGFEEMEATAVMDVLRRGGVKIESVSINREKEVKSAHGMTIIADRRLKEIDSEEAECLIFPGGMPGARHLEECGALIELMQRQYDAGGLLAAICAAPALVLGHLKIDRELHLTCYPGFGQFLPKVFKVSTQGVITDGNVITGKGPGFALKFGLTLLEHLTSAKVAKEVAEGMLL